MYEVSGLETGRRQTDAPLHTRRAAPELGCGASGGLSLLGASMAVRLSRFYAEEDPLNLCVFTWNIGHAAPAALELDQWLPEGGAGLDILVVATQENAYFAKQSARSDFLAATQMARPLAGDDDASDDESERPLGGEASQTKTRKFKPARPWLVRVLSPWGTMSSGKSDWTSRLCGGKNLFGKREHTEHWEQLVLARLNMGKAGGRWRVVKHCVLAEMRLTIYERVRPPTPSLAVVRTSSRILSARDVTLARRDRVALGKGGVVANKGGLAVELRIGGGTPLLIIAAHLAAHDQGVLKRNAQARTIVEVLSRRSKIGLGRGRRGFEGKMDLLDQYDHVLIVGDLNYRIDLNVPRAEDDAAALVEGEEVTDYAPGDEYYLNLERRQADAARVRELVAKRDWASLRDRDQLKYAQRRGHALVDFTEAVADYEPTFKVKRGLAPRPEESYGTPKDPKMLRVPSWCDRVLWRSLPHLDGALAHKSTRPVPGVTTSDHKPLCSTFELTLSPAFVRSIHPVVLRFSGVKLIGTAAGVAKVLGNVDRVKLRFFTSPPGVLVEPGRRGSSGLAWEAGEQGPPSVRRNSSRSVSRAKVRTKVLPTSAAAADSSGRPVLCWQDADVPSLLLACTADQLDRVTIIVGLFGYSRKNTRRGNSKLHGTVRLHLSKPDANGVVTLAQAAPCTMQHFARHVPLQLDFALRADVSAQTAAAQAIAQARALQPKLSKQLSLGGLANIFRRPAPNDSPSQLQLARCESAPPEMTSPRDDITAASASHN